MITVFNRRELVSTYESAVQAALREKLAAAGIDYRLKVVDRSGASGVRTRMGSFGQKNQLQYILYVRRQDWEAAKHVIGKNN